MLSSGSSKRDSDVKVTFFAGSVVGYHENPAALLTRGLAHGLALRGNDVRVVEERQNHAFARTLRAHGAGAARHFHDHFGLIQHHTFEPRSGAPLLEWVSREIALIDVAVAVEGVGDELCRWLANVTRLGLTRAYLAWHPEHLSAERSAHLEIERFDLILAPTEPLTTTPGWGRVEPTLARPDADARLSDLLPEYRQPLSDPVTAAELFERAVKTPLRT
jgi:hypothetical protein